VSETAFKRQGQPSEISDGEHEDPNRLALPRYWVSKDVVESAFGDYRKPWFPAVTKVTSATNARTFIPVLLPRYPLADSSFAMLLNAPSATAQAVGCFLSSVSSSIFDYVARQKLGGVNMLAFIQKPKSTTPEALLQQFERAER